MGSHNDYYQEVLSAGERLLEALASEKRMADLRYKKPGDPEVLLQWRRARMESREAEAAYRVLTEQPHYAAAEAPPSFHGIGSSPGMPGTFFSALSRA